MRYLFLLLSAVICHANSPTIIITCATGEIGSSAARCLAPDHNLILTGRNLFKLEQLQKELQSAYSQSYEICPLDYTDSQSIAQFKEQISQSTISGFVLIPPRPSFHGKSLFPEEEVWLQVFQTTFTGPVEVFKAVLPQLSEGGKIVTIAGTSSVQYLPEAGPTCVIRRMWTTYMKALSHQLGSRRISVNTVSPGVILTPFHEQRIEREAQQKGISFDEQLAKDVSSIPLARHANTAEIANIIRFFLSDQSQFINGTNLVIDGGYTVTY